MAYSRLARGMTLGVRAMLIKEGHVLLVKHSYVPGWYFPGGGVEAGESLGEALEREVREEAGATLTGMPQLFGIYRNERAHRGDHVALYVCREWDEGAGPRLPNREIIACALFPLAAPPEGTTPATRARIREVIGGEAPSADW